MNYKKQRRLRKFKNWSIYTGIVCILLYLCSLINISQKEIRESKIITHNGKTIVKVGKWEYLLTKNSDGITYIDLKNGKILDNDSYHLRYRRGRIEKIDACRRYNNLNEYRGLYEKKLAELEAKEEALKKKEIEINSKLQTK